MIEQHSRDFNHPFVQVDTKPDPITVDITKTAILVVDMQNDFASPGGMFDRAGIDVSLIRQAIDPTARVLAAARNVGIKVVYLKMGFRPDLDDLGTPNSANRVRHLAFGVGQPSMLRMARPAGFSSATPGIQTSWKSLHPRTAMLSSINIAIAASTRRIWTRPSGKWVSSTSSSPGAPPVFVWSQPLEMRCSETMLVCCWPTAWRSPSGMGCQEAIMRPRSCSCRSYSVGFRMPTSSL